MQLLCNQLNLTFCERNSVSAKANVIFTSWIKNIDTAIAGLDIVAMTSLNEGTPVSLIEAQSAGKPVVSTNVGGVENVVQDGISGLLSPSNYVNAFAENLLAIINSDDLRYNLSKTGWELMKNKFHYTRLVEEVRDLYHALLKSNA
jgi:glycosyltransferase involved in cell wall biosynthesis